MTGPLEEFEYLRRTSTEPVAPTQPQPLSRVESANLLWKIRSKRAPDITPFGILPDYDDFERIQRSAENAIRNCKSHKPPNCGCWASTRNWLWNSRKRYPQRSPEGWWLSKIWQELENTEEKHAS